MSTEDSSRHCTTMYWTTIAYRDTTSSAWKDQVTLTLPHTALALPAPSALAPHFTAIQHKPRTARKLPLQVRWCAAGAAPGRRLSAWVAWCACQNACAAAECSPDPASAPSAAAHTAHMGHVIFDHTAYCRWSSFSSVGDG